MDDLKLVEHWWQVFTLRSIRNECREFMTHERKKIGIVQQFEWYVLKYSAAREVGKQFAYLYFYQGEPVGYGFVRIREDGAWITGGLREKSRGRGLGRRLFEKLIEEWGRGPMMLEVLESNVVAKKLYRSLGFKRVDVRDHGRVVIMRRPKRRDGNELTQ